MSSVLVLVISHVAAAGAGAFFYAKAMRWLGKKASADIATMNRK